MIVVMTALALVLCFSMTVYGASAGNYSHAKTGKVTAKVLNVRGNASTSGKILGKVYKGNEIALLGYNGKYYRIKYNGKRGYVQKSYVKKSGTASYTIFTPYKKGKVKNDDVRVRAAASLSGKVRGEYDKGKTLTIMGTKKGSGMTWYRVMYKGKPSYIAAKFVKYVAKPAKVVNYKTFKTGITRVKSKIRSGASTDSSINGTLKKGLEFTIRGYVVNKGQTWYKTLYAGKTSYISASNVRSVKKADRIFYRPFLRGYSKSGTVNVRKEPSASSAKIGSYKEGTRITVTGRKTVKGVRWYRIKTKKGKFGYIKASLLRVKATGGADEIARWANKKVGTPYGAGGVGPNRFDCSGFVWWVFHNADATTVKFKRSSATAYYNAFKRYRVSASKATKGDIVFFGTGTGNIGHVGVCAEDGNIVHATTRLGVRKHKLSSVRGCGKVVAVIRLPYK